MRTPHSIVGLLVPLLAVGTVVSSEPDESQTAWMYRGALEPVGHNGDIPSC